MGNSMSKLVALMLLSLLALSGLVMIGSAFAQSIPKPSVPEFTVEFVDFYDVPPTYEVDPSTGETIIIQEGFRSDLYHFVFTIENQPFTPYTDEDDNLVRMFFRVDYKFDFDEHWSSWGLSLASDSEYTEFAYICGLQAGEPKLRNVISGDKLYFKVQAYIGYTVMGYDHEKSDWSDIQALVIPDDPPRVMLLSPQNGTYNISDFSLDFIVDNDAFQFKYSLDGAENVTVAGNATLTGLGYGLHNLTVYANDRLGNIGASETLFFTITEPFPTSLFIVSAVIVAVVLVGLGLLVYRIKKNSIG